MFRHRRQTADWLLDATESYLNGSSSVSIHSGDDSSQLPPTTTAQAGAHPDPVGVGAGAGASSDAASPGVDNMAGEISRNPRARDNNASSVFAQGGAAGRDGGGARGSGLAVVSLLLEGLAAAVCFHYEVTRGRWTVDHLFRPQAVTVKQRGPTSFWSCID